jgi:hypothetical protein
LFSLSFRRRRFEVPDPASADAPREHQTKSGLEISELSEHGPDYGYPLSIKHHA